MAQSVIEAGFENAHKAVIELIKDFESKKEIYRNSEYSEARLRIDFLDKFFKALGWDVSHDFQKNPYEQEVKIEPPVAVEGRNKRADYSFSLSPNFRDPIFFAEAKKPSVDLGTPDAYFQTMRYAWNRSTPIALLSNFFEFHVLDCRYKPKIENALERGAIENLKFIYSDLLDENNFQKIYFLFSREAIIGNSLEKFTASLPTAKGKGVKKGLLGVGHQKIDEIFLEELDGFRITLAKAFKKRNSNLESYPLTEAVQRTIDRLVFIRFLEDKLIEEKDYISTFGKSGSAWKNFVKVCRKLDPKYNGLIFHEHFIDESEFHGPDEIEFGFICDELSHSNSPYDFNAIPIDILGSIYERFLGNVIRATDKQVRIEQKEDVKKAGGVFYTPQYVVNYIVNKTVGKLISGKNPQGISTIKIIDIACGSGSFLLEVFELLIRYHTEYYNKFPKQIKVGDCEFVNGRYKISIRKKREILLNNIFGIDIDPQAVEVTQLSLYLKLLEDETTASTIQTNLEFKEAILPSLVKNIFCGNSLIERDFVEADLFEDTNTKEEELRPFDFKSTFSNVMKNGGFDCVIGNPPWGAEIAFKFKDYFIKKYSHIHMRTPESFNYFLGKADQILNNAGLVGYIIPNNFLFQHEYAKCREYFLENFVEAINLGDGVFKITAPSCIAIFSKEKHGESLDVLDLRNVERHDLPKKLVDGVREQISFEQCKTLPDTIIPMDPKSFGLVAKISKDKVELGSLCSEVAAGIGTGGDKAFRILREEARKFEIEKDLLKPVLVGRDIHDFYVPEKSDHVIIYSTKTVTKKSHPKAIAYLEQFKDKLSQKRETKKGMIPWWSLHWPRYPELFDSPKILLRQTADSLYAALDEHGFFCLNSILVLKMNEPEFNGYLVGLLNSKLLRWYYKQITQEASRVFAEVKPINVRKLPIKVDASLDEKRMLATIGKKISEYKTKEILAQTDRDRNFFKTQIESEEGRLNELVYKIYGMTKQDIESIQLASI